MNTLTTILSIIAGGIITYLIARWQMKKNKIVHFSQNSYDIGKGLSDEFQEFKLYYNGENLANDVIVLKGGFMNTGCHDIDGLKGKSDIKLTLPEECKVKAVAVYPSSEDLLVNAVKEDNVIHFGISDVFKTDEFFKYTAIVETSNKQNVLFNNLKFQHRILNTEKIRNTVLFKHSPKDKYMRKGLLVSILLALLISPLTMLYERIGFEVYNKDTNTEVKVYVGPQSQLFVTERATLVPFIIGKKITTMDLDNNYRITTKYMSKNERTVFVIVFYSFFILLLLLYYYVLFDGKDYHINNVLEKADH